MMTNDSPPTVSAPPGDTPVVKPPRMNPKWVGPILAFFLPGSAHFLSGQYLLGVFLLFACILLQVLACFLITTSGIGFYVGVGLYLIYILLLIAVLISSWRPTRQLGRLGWILFIVVLLSFNHAIKMSGVLSWRTYGEVFVIGSGAMAPTLVGPSEFDPKMQSKQSLERVLAKQYLERILVNRWIYRVSDPKRGDVAIFKMNIDGASQTWTMRIVGLPGETVDIEPPYVLINGQRLTKPPIFAKIASRQDGFPGYCTAQEIAGEGVPLPLTLGADEYFVLGDNSPHSRDSRFIGPVLRQNITGKVIRIFYPLDRVREVE